MSRNSRALNRAMNNFFNTDRNAPHNYKVTFRCFPISMLEGSSLKDEDVGGRILLPSSALSRLTLSNVAYPMMFKLTNKKTKLSTHSGVLEFTAKEGTVHLPLWMMRNLELKSGDKLTVEGARMSSGTFAKFQALSTDFLKITNPKAVLEHLLRKFTCLTAGDVIPISYNNAVHELRILEIAPGAAINIIECDLHIEFEAPVGYEEEQESSVPKKVVQHVESAETDSYARHASNSNVRGIPDYSWEFGSLAFQRNFDKREDDGNERNKNSKGFTAFGGKGYTLK